MESIEVWKKNYGSFLNGTPSRANGIGENSGAGLAERWLHNFGRRGKWNFCLTAGKIGPRIRREHEQKTAPEPCIGL